MALRKSNGKQGRFKKTALLFVAAAFIAFGLWLTTTTGFKLAYGYFLYKIGAHSETETVAAPVEEAPEAIPAYENDLQDVASWQPEIGEEMGTLTIPKIDATLPIIHGTSEDELDKGVGHFADSVLPGEKDNSVLSGHRDTVFRKLGEVGEGDELIVETRSGVYTYKVHTVRIVDEDDRTVIVPTEEAQLTVITCYPFDFIGAAPDRYVLVADLIDEDVYETLALFPK